MTAWSSTLAPPGRVARRQASPLAVGCPARRLLSPALVCADMAAAAGALAVVLRLHFGPLAPDLHVGGVAVPYVAAGLVLAPAWAVLLGLHDAYGAAVTGPADGERQRVVRAGAGLLAAIAVAHLVLGSNLPGGLSLAAVGLTVVFTLALRLVVHHAQPQVAWTRRTLVVGSRHASAALARQLGGDRAAGLDVVGTYALDDSDGSGALPEAQAVVAAAAAERADVVAVAAGASPDDVRRLAWALEGSDVALMVAPAVPDLPGQRAVASPVGDTVLLQVPGCRLSGFHLAVKNLIDRLGAALALAVLAPVMMAVAVAVKATSAGPVLYRQQRVGQGGRAFTFLKFRTMVCDADARLGDVADQNQADGLLFKIFEDPRVTPVGQFLRRTSLDELPQLWNVLRGDMSLVGPRPLPVRAQDLVGEAGRRLRVKPGLTGLWQVSGRSDLSWDETVRLDRHYVDHWSLGLDLAILLRTPAAVLVGRGAY